MLDRMLEAAREYFGDDVTRDELSDLVNNTRNSLKHANRKDEDAIEYDTSEAAAMLFRALVNYQIVTVH
jgi:hypothetical protein